MNPGDLLGPYRVLEKLGEGGMGEVYKARDTRLDRTVAIKVLPPGVSGDPERRARFEREAKAIAALNHPHICVLHDVGDLDGSLFLVMEHLSGQTLAQRLHSGQLPLEQSLELGAQIVDALARAHRHGILHRDLKPANVMITKDGVKLLDFGLAELRREQAAGTEGLSGLSTAPLATKPGLVMGTVPYMAPELLEGKEADARSELFAFGCVLYEMLTARRAFGGDSEASVISAIMASEPPPIATFQPLTPPALDRMVRKCLSKDPESRWQTASDAADELRWLASQSTGPLSTAAAPGARRRWAIAAAVLSLVVLPLAAFALGAWLFRSAGTLPALGTQRLEIASSAFHGGDDVAVSPDGRLVAFTASEKNGRPQLYIRPLDSWRSRAVTTMPGRDPCFSPDGRWLAFVRGEDRVGAIWKVPVTGGAAQKIASFGEGGQLKWLSDGRILFSRDEAGIWILNPSTGAPERLVGPEDTGRGGRYGSPEMLPGGGAVLFSILSQGRATVFAYSLRDRRLVQLLESAIRPRYVAAAGQLLYQSGRQLFAVRFDADALKVAAGETRLVADEAGNGDAFRKEFDVSPAGVLVYLPPRDSELVWKDRAGKATALPFKPRRYKWVDLSPDGRKAVLQVAEGTANRVYHADLDRGEPLTRLTTGDDDWFGLFSPDGAKVLLTTSLGGNYNVAAVAADGRIEPVTKSPGWQKASAFWPLGPVLLVNAITPSVSEVAVMEVRLDQPGGEPRAVVAADAVDADFSPDGRFIAYEQPTDGRQEVYIQGYPLSGLKARVSVEGGRSPVWNPKGRELFFWSPAKGVMAVRVENGVRLSTPTLLFEAWNTTGWRTWDVSPDGSRFLVAEVPEARRGVQVNVITNWFEELRAQVPASR